MNQHRIRIYELSKELNLNNQELLALCARLNIAARSHSSTISQFDAEHLRLIAKKPAQSVLSHKQQLLGISVNPSRVRELTQNNLKPSQRLTSFPMQIRGAKGTLV